MKLWEEPLICSFFAGLFGLLTVATLTGAWLRRVHPDTPAVINLNERVTAWWWMVGLVLAALFMGNLGTVLLFAFVSFLSLREFISLISTRRADHRPLFWIFFVVLPLQYYFVAIAWYGMMSIFIPVFAFTFLSIRAALAGDPKDYLTRTAKIQWAVMVCVFSLSHIPALLMVAFPGGAATSFQLMLFLLFVAQISDVLQYIFGKLWGKTPVAPELSPKKTVAGLVGGVGGATLLGLLLHPMTPFTWWEAGLIALLVAVLGFFGGLVLSAIKRDQGVKDFGESLPGHGGLLDRVDSLCLSAPVYFHVVRYFFAIA